MGRALRRRANRPPRSAGRVTAHLRMFGVIRERAHALDMDACARYACAMPENPEDQQQSDESAAKTGEKLEIRLAGKATASAQIRARLTKGTKVWIPCKVSEGMFSNEFAVEISLPSGEKLSLYVDKSLIQGTGDNAKLRVYVVESSDKEITVLLPSESFQGSRWVRVPQSELVPA